MSRSDARSGTLRRRPPRVVPASIVAVILLAVAVGLVWLAVLRLRDGSWPAFVGRVNGWATALTWGSTLAIVISLGVLLVGVVLLVAGIKPGQPNAMKLTSTTSSDAVSGTTELIITRRAVAKLATGRATQIDGVDTASSTVSGRRVAVAVTSPSEQRGELEGTVTGSVRDALERAGVSPMPAIRTTVRTTRP